MFDQRRKLKKCGATGKRRYPTKHAALMAISSILRQQKARKLRPYFCVMCEDWHLTHRERVNGETKA